MNRLKLLRINNNKTQKEIADYLGISDVAYYYYETEKRDMSPDTIKKLSDYYNVSTDYLLGKSEEKNVSKKYYMCPVYGRIAAGLPSWAEQIIEGRIPIDPDMMNIANPEECFFLRVNGESMNKEIANGGYALIRRTDFVENGDIAVVIVGDNEATLKKFSKQGDLVVLEPMSTDESFTTQVYGQDTKVVIIGKYIGKMEMK